MKSPTGQTRQRIFTLDGSNNVDSRKDVPFGGFVHIFFIILEVKYPPPKKKQFLGREKRFSSQRKKK